MSELVTNKITPSTGSSDTVTLGDSGDTFVIPSGVTITNSGTATGFGGGKLIKVVGNTVSAMSTMSVAIPHDNTIPQNTEGAEVMTQAITPANVNNILYIHVNIGEFANATANWLVTALFQDTTANAIAAVHNYHSTGNTGTHCGFIHKMTAGTTSSTTFKVRLGAQDTNTTTFNGAGGAAYMGGVMSSSIIIQEVEA